MTERPKPSRSYKLGKRGEGVDKRRAEIVAAARKLILSKHALAGFTVDAVAKQAGVTRATVYSQFGFKTGLLGAMFDDLAVCGQMNQLPDAFKESDPYDALDSFINTFVTFWSADRLLTRRLYALATLDANLEKALEERQAGRRRGLRVILERTRKVYDRPKAQVFDETLEILYTLTSFATFDSLADKMAKEDVIHTVQRLSWATLTDTVRE